MTLVLDVLSAALLIAGLFFFTAGTVGLLRLPDVRSRLHALTKADNLGLGLILAGVALQAASVTTTVLLILVWLLALLSASLSARLIGGFEAEDAAHAGPDPAGSEASPGSGAVTASWTERRGPG